MQRWIIWFAMDEIRRLVSEYLDRSESSFIVVYVCLRIALPTNRWNEIKVVGVYGKTKAPLNPQ